MTRPNSKSTPGEKLIASNPHAKWNYFIEEILEAGLVLQGTEVKSLRNQTPNLKEAFVEVNRKGSSFEGWLVNMSVAHYVNGNIWNHEPSRKRKLLLHAHELANLFAEINQKGMSVIPVRIYFKQGRAKVEIGIGKGKKNHDKRAALKNKSIERELEDHSTT